jgi:hypothetical protein
MLICESGRLGAGLGRLLDLRVDSVMVTSPSVSYAIELAGKDTQDCAKA